jgi:hypothetical protein
LYWHPRLPARSFVALGHEPPRRCRCCRRRHRGARLTLPQGKTPLIHYGIRRCGCRKRHSFRRPGPAAPGRTCLTHGGRYSH